MKIGSLKNIAFFGLTLLIGGSIGSVEGSYRATNDTLLLCNQKPHECKFKYDILMYEKEGHVPYANASEKKVQPKEEKK